MLPSYARPELPDLAPNLNHAYMPMLCLDQTSQKYRFPGLLMCPRTQTPSFMSSHKIFLLCLVRILLTAHGQPGSLVRQRENISEQLIRPRARRL
jgi:hypothetical protein